MLEAKRKSQSFAAIQARHVNAQTGATAVEMARSEQPGLITKLELMGLHDGLDGEERVTYCSQG